MQRGAQHSFYAAGVFLALFAFNSVSYAESEIVQAAAIAAQAAGAIGKAAIEGGSAVKQTAMKAANSQQTLTKTIMAQMAKLEDGLLLNKLRTALTERLDVRQTASDMNKFAATQAANLATLNMQASMQTAQRAYDYGMKNLLLEFQTSMAAKQRQINELVAQLTAQATGTGAGAQPVTNVSSGAGLMTRSLGSEASNVLVSNANSNLGQGFTRARAATPAALTFNPIVNGSTSRAMNRGSALAQFQQSMRGRRRDLGEGIPHRSLASIEAPARSNGLATHGGIRSFSDSD